MKKNRAGSRKSSSAARGASSAASIAPQRAYTFPVVGIGASAGGLEAFKELIGALRDRAGMAYVLVPHLDPGHESALTEILSSFTKIPIAEVKNGMTVERDHIYVIPPNKTMGLSAGRFTVAERSVTQTPHLPIDHFFNALAGELGDQSIGIILSGTASDGTQGCIAIKVAGGVTFAQDEKSAKYFDMPWNAVQGGSVDFVLPPREIARELARLRRRPQTTRITDEALDAELTVPSSELDSLFALLYKSSAVDFRHYKQSTLHRRIRRRLTLRQFRKLKDYLRFIRQNPGELDALYRDLLIHVTEFFRDEGAFDSLQKKILPAILESRGPDEGPLRIWIPGCSTGQEVYSLAMVVLEFLWNGNSKKTSRTHPNFGVQIFATDIGDYALERARSGIYAANEVLGVSKERLKRFFVRHNGGFQIHKSVRELCIFAKQNVIKDPPFSNLDLISCRNLLIYFGRVLQKRVIPTFYYSLKNRGYLMLGPSESLGSFEDLFALVDKKHKIYQKKRHAGRLAPHFVYQDYAIPRPDRANPSKGLEVGFDADREVETVLASRFVPPSIVVNEQMEIVQFRGKVGPYLGPASGHPTLNLSRMAREDLQVDLRDVLSRAKKEKRPVRKAGLRIKFNGGTRDIDLEAIPVRGQSAAERLYVIAFQDSVRPAPPSSGAGKRDKQPGKERISGELVHANEEIQRLREQLHTLIEEHETTLEEFKSANAEILSANEELQSTNEELETTKEELQSSNEELSTLNEELQSRNAELTMANNDQLNLMTNVNIPVLMVGNDLRIRRFTHPAEELLNLLPGDVGRRLGELRFNLEPDNLEKPVRTTIENAIYTEQEVRQKNGPWFLLRVRPYKTWDNKVEGAVITFQNIDSLKRSLDETRSFAEALIENAHESIAVLDEGLRITIANPQFYKSFHLSPEQTKDRPIYDVGNREWDIPEVRELFHKIMTRPPSVDGIDLDHEFKSLGLGQVALGIRRVDLLGGPPHMILTIHNSAAKPEKKK